MISDETNRSALKIFRRRKIITVLRLSKLLRASIPTARNRLKDWRTYTSYNHNGRFYTLPEIPVFDPFGIWRYKDIFFSKHGTLKQTVINLVRVSEKGLSAPEISQLVGVSHRSFLSHFKDVTGIKREKIMDRFVYFSKEQHTYLKQKRLREESLLEPIQLPTDSDAILIFVDRIKHPDSSIKATNRRIRAKGIKISCDLICNLLEYHGIEKKT